MNECAGWDSRDGRPIYSDQIWSRLVEIGQRLGKVGYDESGRKPNLFYRKIEGGVLFADLRGTEEIPIWDSPCPLLYFSSEDENLPDESKRPILKSEFVRLRTNGCEPRFSFHYVSEPDGLFFGDEEVSNNCPE